MKITGTRLKSQAKATQGYTAAIAAIGQASIIDTKEAKTPEDVQKWQTFCVEMRDASAAVNAAIRKQDRAAVEDTMARLQKSCDECHKVFHQAALSK
jgi:cytochrome c556